MNAKKFLFISFFCRLFSDKDRRKPVIRSAALFAGSFLLVFSLGFPVFPLLSQAGPVGQRGYGNHASEMVIQTEGSFILNGKLSGMTGAYVYLSYTGKDGSYRTDSSRVSNGVFKFEGSVNAPGMAVFSSRRNPGSSDDPHLIRFFLEPVKLMLTAAANDMKKAKITGSPLQQQYQEYERAREVINQRYKTQLDSLRTEKDHERSAEIRERLAPYFAEMDQADYRLFNRYPDSYVTAYMLLFHVSDLSLDSLKMYYGRLSDKVQQSPRGKELAKEIEQLEGGSPGSMAKDFTTTDINGNKISLSDFNGKYVLLDFWASWCVPCRKGNPHLRELYAKYKDKGIEFIGISDDDSKPDAWREAVKKDQLPWRHVLRGLDWEKRRKNIPNELDISEKFGIHTLPTKILIDPDGKIIGRYSTEEEPLDRKLKEIFDDSATTSL